MYTTQRSLYLDRNALCVSSCLVPGDDDDIMLTEGPTDCVETRSPCVYAIGKRYRKRIYMGGKLWEKNRTPINDGGKTCEQFVTVNGVVYSITNTCNSNVKKKKKNVLRENSRDTPTIPCRFELETLVRRSDVTGESRLIKSSFGRPQRESLWRFGLERARTSRKLIAWRVVITRIGTKARRALEIFVLLKRKQTENRIIFLTFDAFYRHNFLFARARAHIMYRKVLRGDNICDITHVCLNVSFIFERSDNCSYLYWRIDFVECTIRVLSARGRFLFVRNEFHTKHYIACESSAP